MLLILFIIFIISIMKQILILLLVTFALSQNPPIYPNKFEIDFNQTVYYGLIKAHTKGKIFYNYDDIVQLITRQNGKDDRYCGSVEKFANTPCNHYIVGGKRYLDFPTKKYCCYCCNSTHGCGVVKPDWMVSAKYFGLQQIDNQMFEKWDIKGLQNNYYYNTHDQKQIPRRLDQYPDDLMDFDVNSYYLGIRDQSIFDLPPYCTQKCGILTICEGLRGEGNIQRQQ